MINASDRIKQVEKYMNQKYKEFNDEFVCENAYWAGLFCAHDTYHMASKRFPEFNVVVYYYSKEKHYEDNYMEYVFMEPAQELMQPIFEKHFGECKVFIRLTGGPFADNCFNEKTTLQEYLSYREHRHRFGIFVEEDKDIPEKIRKVCSEVKELNIVIGYSQISVVPYYKTIKGFQNILQVEKYQDSLSYEENKYKFYRVMLDEELNIEEISEGYHHGDY